MIPEIEKSLDLLSESWIPKTANVAQRSETQRANGVDYKQHVKA
jgi:hypothetical protein